MIQYDQIWINATLVTLADGDKYGVTENAAIAVQNGLIILLKSMSELDLVPTKMARQVTDVKGKCITPGLIDCHSHIIYGGDRAREFEMRLQGKSYAELSRQGGGIMSTVIETRNASEQELIDCASDRLTQLIRDGVTTIEIKSGYGLDFESERKMLRVAQKLETLLPIRIKKTFLGAHTVPPEYQHKRAAYVDLICEQMLPMLHSEGLLDAVDAFCEDIAFSVEEVERVFQSAIALGIPVKLHAEQLSNSGGAALAAKYQALSADHLEHLDESGVRAMSASNTVAVLLPGAYFMLRETQKPPIELLRKYHVPMAVATDSNPGTSPVLSARLMMSMACQQFGLTTCEALRGMTINAAKALGLENELGSLEVGKVADMVIWDVDHPSELVYWLGGNKAKSIIKQGVEVQIG